MTGLLAALLVLLAGAALAAAVTRNRKDRPVSLSRISTDPTTDPAPAELPPGYDDPASLSFVPDPLRPFWPVGPFDRLDERDACERHGDVARRDVALSLDDPGVEAWRSSLRSYDRSRAPLPGEYLRHRYGSGALPPLSDVERARAVHLERLDRAAAARAAELEAERSAEMRARYTCPVCGTSKATIVPALCDPCADVAAELTREESAARVLPDGRTRRDAVRAWIDRA